MCNEKEGDTWIVDITLMYTHETPSYHHTSLGKEAVAAKMRGKHLRKDAIVSKKGNEKSLRELLEEQDIGVCLFS